MPKQAISVTLDRDNVVWLKARALGRGARSLSAELDDVIRRARGAAGAVASVRGLAEIADQDPGLQEADAAVRALFAASLRGPRRGRRRRG